MLDLKLRLYIPLLKRMPPGVFIAAADALEAFDIDSNSTEPEVLFRSDGFTSFGHLNQVSSISTCPCVTKLVRFVD